MTVLAFFLFILVWVSILLVIRYFTPEPFKLWLTLLTVVLGLIFLLLQFLPQAANYRIG